MPINPRVQAYKPSMMGFVASLMLSTAAHAAPPIRTGGNNEVPTCVSPERLMAFVRDRNDSLDPRYEEIARWYKHYGEAWRVRWDYAFFQMVLETNYLKYRRGDGSRGDVHERQNNFAGIGATGGGVAGERFKDIKTGVHAQIQHLVAYSGEHVSEPVAKRTDENQDDIIAKSRRLGRPVTFGDLARRWAADRQYAKNIDYVAGVFRDGYCKGPAVAQGFAPPAPEPAKRRFPKPAGLGGPKPQMLAGPETLPWRTEPDSVAQAAAPDPAAPEAKHPPKDPTPATHAKSPPAVRTIWSREGGTAPATADRAPDKPPAPESGIATAAAPQPPLSESEQAHPAGSVSPAVSASAAPPPQDDAPIELPTFRIAPVTPQPSRLGGPIEAAARPARALPPGTLVEADPPPLAPAAPPVRRAPQLATMSTPRAEPFRPAAEAQDCRVLAASFGGKKTLLLQSDVGGVMQLTALTVLDGFETSMTESYSRASAPGAKVVASFDNKADALAKAKSMCPGS